MSVAPTRDRIGAVLAVALALVAVILLSPGTGGATATRADAASPTSSPCPGSLLAHNYTGVVVPYGAAAPPPISLRYSYNASEVVQELNGSVLSSSCPLEQATVVSAPGGTLNLSIDPTPTVNCSVDPPHDSPCLVSEGPYTTVDVSVASGVPAGDFATVDWNGTSFSVRLDPYLASLRLDPGPTAATFSTGATDEIRADPLTGAGNATPGSPTFSWTLSGNGWSFVGAPDGGSVNVTAVPGAGPANLSVVARLGIDGATLVASASESLQEVPTAITSATLDRTIVDVGQPVTAWANGTAAAGYSYAMTVEPGFGAPAQTAPCATRPGPTGTVVFDCTTTLAYAAAGTAQPSALVSNGASASAWAFPAVAVHPDPALAFDPEAPAGYENLSIPISVGAAGGTGAAPYARACFSSGVGAVECRSGPGPTWEFSATYPAPGNYSVTAWAIDAAGANSSAVASVHVVPPLSVLAGGLAANATVGVPVPLAATLSGGDLPARVWWNASGAPAPIAVGWADTDGALGATFDPFDAGFATVSVTAVDALGTVATASETFAVGVGAATQAVASTLPPLSAVRAGTPFGVAWQALDAGGDSVHDFAGDATIELVDAASGSAVAGAVNSSGAGPLASPLPGWFRVPPSAWLDGRLTVNVSADVAGTVEVRLVIASGLPVEAVPVSILPDVDHLVLSDPRPVEATARAGATLWSVRDRFGNPAVGASLVIASSWDGSTQRTLAPVFTGTNGSTEAWVNYSIPGAWAGTVRVTDLAGQLLIPLVSVGGLAGSLAALPTLPILLAVGAGATVGAGAYARRRSRERPPAPPDEEAELQRLAEGQATVVALVDRWGPIDLAGLATLWEPPPAPADLADWVAALLTDGSLDAAFGPDGVARFCRPRTLRASPIVTVDLSEFDRALSRRDALVGERDPDDR